MHTLPKSRADARLLNSIKYLAKKPCTHGHAPVRYTSNGICVECRKVISGKYVGGMSQEQKDKALAKGRRADAKRRSKPKRAEYMAKYLSSYERDRTESNKRYYSKNKDAIIERSKEFRLSNSDYYTSKCAERRFRKAQATPSWSESDKIRKVYKMAKKYNLEVDHIVPLSSDIVCGMHCWHNLQLLDRKHNAEKLNKAWPDMP